MEAPLKSEVFCSSFMHFSPAFGVTIWQVINVECWMVLHLLCFFSYVSYTCYVNFSFRFCFIIHLFKISIYLSYLLGNAPIKEHTFVWTKVLNRVDTNDVL